jgi:chemotaxis protein methyltransferase CheR
MTDSPFFRAPASEDELPDEIYRAICQLVLDYCGLSFGENSKFIVQKRVAKRMAALQEDDYQKYYYHLLYDKDGHRELDQLVELLTTGETYFFREMNQLNAFIHEIIPEIIEAGAAREKRNLKIWSAGCASGEEPYTLATLLLEKNLPPEWNVEIFGSDINRTLLHQARAGVYRENSFRTTDDYFRAKYFERIDDKTHRIRDEVKKSVTFGWVNLYDVRRPLIFGEVDVILCRNVIIYFDKAGKNRVIDSLYERLRPGGFLLLGHSESLLNVSTKFRLRHFKHDMVYQK